ncbi:glycoside hydrolase family 88/105 protein [Paenibacillus sp. y28]|uniref:glycoside hydrolase family 88/105 protein n=1 Tax=Paenibacillus sp. y28 TaxID=3129110 RepID=UPI003018AEB4
MTKYFQEQESIRYRFGDNDSAMLKVLADRYIGANPQAGFAFRTFFEAGILQNDEGLFVLDLSKRFPEAKPGQIAYAGGLVWSDGERSLDVLIRSLGPVRFYFNGDLAYRSTVMDELDPEATVKLNLHFTKGWNSLLLSLTSTPAGFGCLFGPDEAKVRILNVLSPFQERAGQAGWAYSEPVDRDVIGEGAFPDLLASERQYGLQWLPQTNWPDEQLGMPALQRIYGHCPGHGAYAWTKLNKTSAGQEPAVLEGTASGPVTVWVAGKPAVVLEEGGSFRTEIELGGGRHDVLVHSLCTAEPWGFTLQAATSDGAVLPLEAPYPVHGLSGEPWLYTGPFPAQAQFAREDLTRIDRLYPLEGTSHEAAVEADGASGAGGQSAPANGLTTAAGTHTYWRLDRPKAWVRPYYENAMLSNKWTVGSVTNYARWDYPLGVTIYGLLQTGRYLERPDVVQYALEHVQACTTMFDYSLWDKERYGFPAINQQLVMMKMLDNCGSFGSAMLEAHREGGDGDFLRIGHRIADFMLHRLERREDGAFYRKCPGEYSANTMWADDLYMSTPFLCRYARLTGTPEALDEAARQFLLFRRYLFMPEQRIMSHVYDFKYGQATQIPWGRGNGWTIFSLSEVLEALPEGHEARPELLAFFNELCGGYAALQADSGLWHQVLNDDQTYEEASCTAMFAYAFSRGVRFGWLEEPVRFTEAAIRAWDGLTRIAIDRQGNVHGVCSGSRYAFTAEYYNKDLLTVTNDNHGIGIMMLAGTEVAKLKSWLAGEVV